MTEQWLADRAYLRAHRRGLTSLAERLYPRLPRVGASQLLTRPEWVPSRPLPLESLTLAWRCADSQAGASRAAPFGPSAATPFGPSAATPFGSSEVTPAGSSEVAPVGAVLPAGGFTRYSQAVAALDPPRVFVDRPTYRLLGADLAHEALAEFTLGRYFDILDVGEAAAHEFAALVRAGDVLTADPVDGLARVLDRLPMRRSIGDPTDPTLRPMAVAVTALTIRLDASRDDPRFLVHWRDPAKVATNHGMYTTIPVGVFQPSDSDDAVRDATRPGEDFDLWRGIAREYGEELLGQAEHRDVDYARWPFFQSLERYRRAGGCRPYCLGLGVDPLTLAVDLLVVVVFEAEAFDTLFAGLVADNEEGRTTTLAVDGTFGIPFTAAEVRRLVSAEHTQPASAAILDAAWRARVLLLQR